jgi:putative glutamine amidotransferase
VTTAHSLPIVLVPACNRMLGEHPFSVVGKKYLDAVRLAGCLPVVMPTDGSAHLGAWLSLADGIFLTGSPSNVHPSHFNETVHDPSLPLDPTRDATTLPLIPRALAMGLPLFAICRGFQEANVALGGSLHQAVQEVAGQHDHRGAGAVPGTSAELTYDFAHSVNVVPGGVLEEVLGKAPFEVNSVHGQGVNRLAAGLRVEARAPDGLIEAFSMPEAKAFNLCVQWHPEWQAASNAVSMRLLKAFGGACQSYRDRHRESGSERERDPDR